MGCTEPLLARLRESVDVDTGEYRRSVEIGGRYTDARAAQAAALAGPDHKYFTPMKLPCGKCLSCQSRHKLQWAHRCRLEASLHQHVTFATLTYSDAPWTLSIRDLQLFHKRLRTGLSRAADPQAGALSRYKHFSCGEYGETFGRPHYHAILFGLGEAHYDLIDKAWGHDFVHLEKAGLGSINYVAGYVNKKRELLTSDADGWQNPFIIMSRGGRTGTGIAGEPRDRYRNSWRNYAVIDGKKAPLSRYLHEGWKKTATAEERETLELEKEEYRRIHGDETDSQRTARAERTSTQVEHSRSKRRQRGTH